MSNRVGHRLRRDDRKRDRHVEPARKSRDDVAPIGESRKEAIARLLEPFAMGEFTRTTLASAIVGNVVWVVHETQISAKRPPVTALHAYLLRHTGDRRWGYEAYVERTGLPYSNCPPALLKLAPATNRTWRKLVLEEYRAATAAKAAVA